jgi:hypothetical protein
MTSVTTVFASIAATSRTQASGLTDGRMVVGMSKRAHFNRSNRRSGGPRRAQIRVGRKDVPALSIQCFESRHGECHGSCGPFFPGPCECPCHRRAES